MNKTKAKNHQPAYTESDESNSTPNLDLSLIRKPIATSVTGFEEVLRAYEDGTNEVSKLNCISNANTINTCFPFDLAEKIIIKRM